MTGIIYKATNLINGKVYIGQTCRKLNKRITDHYNASKRGSLFRFHLALKKYKREDFEWVIIENNIDLKYIDDVEIGYIKQYNSMNF